MIDPEPTLEVLVDGYWPRRGPCLICGVPGEDQRHRIMDAVVSLVRAGDPADMVAENYGVPVLAVAIALLAAVEQEMDDELSASRYWDVPVLTRCGDCGTALQRWERYSWYSAETRRTHIICYPCAKKRDRHRLEAT